MESREDLIIEYTPQVYYVPVDLLGIPLPYTVQFLIEIEYEGIHDDGLIVPRFGYEAYEGIIVDNVTAHIFRVYIIVSLLALPPGVSRDLMFRIVKLHDMPEIWLERDVPAIVKDTMSVDSEFEIAMEKFIGKLADPQSDKSMYKRYDAAELFLGGDFDKLVDIQIEYILVRLLDMMESNMLWHYCIVNWINSDSFKKEGLEELCKKSLPYTFNTFRKTQSALEYLQKNPSDINSDVIDFCYAIIDYQMSWIASQWEEVDVDAIQHDLQFDIRGEIADCMKTVKVRRELRKAQGITQNIYVL